MIGQIISHYKIIEKLGEVRLSAGGGGRDLVPIQEAGRKIS
jgi:hypothetical protein